jgi:hypothetical protein
MSHARRASIAHADQEMTERFNRRQIAGIGNRGLGIGSGMGIRSGMRDGDEGFGINDEG